MACPDDTSRPFALGESAAAGPFTTAARTHFLGAHFMDGAAPCETLSRPGRRAYDGGGFTHECGQRRGRHVGPRSFPSAAGAEGLGGGGFRTVPGPGGSA